MKKIWLGLGFLGFLVQGRVWAIQITPARQEVTVGLGEEARGSVRAKNDRDKPLHVQVAPKNWFIYPENEPLPVAEWLFVEGPQEFELQPGEEKEIPFHVRIPTMTAAGKIPQGSCVAMMSIQEVAEESSGLALTVSVSIYVTVGGTEKIAGVIDDLSVVRQGDNLQVAVTLKNDGNVHWLPSFQVNVADPRGKTSIAIPIADGRPTYPGLKRSYIGRIPFPDLKKGTYKLTADVSLQNQMVHREIRVKFRKGLFSVLPDKKR